ncbi:MAG TPA: hypothetical protein VK578_10320 [Edaphobacter sp.]|nr:hypothetical protein [Edaphobacter sp.]
MPGDNPLIVYATEKGRKNWREVGQAWINDDGSISFKLNMQPLLTYEIRQLNGHNLRFFERRNDG